MKLKFAVPALLICAFVFTPGCAKKADINKPIDKIQAEVQKMSVKDLETYANAYGKEIMNKKAELNKVADELKKLSPQDLFGAKSKGIRDQISKLSKDASELTKRYSIYANKYKELGGDVSKIKIG